MRDYGLEPTLWGGDSNCQHEWINHHQAARGGANKPDNMPNTGANTTMQGMDTLRGNGYDSQFCQKCGCWRGSLGLENSPESYISHLVEIFQEVKRVLRNDGTAWVVVGDSYFGGKGQSGTRGAKHQEIRYEHGESISRGRQTLGGSKQTKPTDGKHPILKPKDMCLIPFRLAIALQEDGWWIRSTIIWHKPNVMPSSVRDRPTVDHEYVFLLAKSKKYYFDQDAIREPHQTYDPRNISDRSQIYKGKFDKGVCETLSSPRARQSREGYEPSYYHPAGRNRRTVWRVNTLGGAILHYAVFPEKLIEPMVLAGSSDKACPYCGAAWIRIRVGSTTNGAHPQRQTDHRDKRPGSTGVMGFSARLAVGSQPSCSCYDEHYRNEFPRVRNKRKRHHQDMAKLWFKRVRKQPGKDTWDTVPCIVFDPFCGSGTTCVVAKKKGRHWIGIEQNPDYVKIAEKRLLETRQQLEFF